METPVWDFVRRYADSGTVRLHMPGHKGQPVLGCEPLDLTEVSGTDGLIEQSETNAAALFGAARTLYSTGGSSQCVRAMVWLAASRVPAGRRPVIVAARNAHKSFLHACAIADAEIVWLWPETPGGLCACPVTAEQLARTLDGVSEARGTPPAAVYVTSPDYLGGVQDIPALSAVCRARKVPLLADNAHGAYLRFLDPSRHPLDLGADLCCDSAHKTLPVLTGGAYLHVSRTAPASFAARARTALDLTGSTSPSWLILASLDRCNRYLSGGYRDRLAEAVRRLDSLRDRLRSDGWTVADSDPLRVTLRGDGETLTDRLRRGGIEWEYADRDSVVLMASPENAPSDFARVSAALGRNSRPGPPPVPPAPVRCEAAMSVREALFSPWERVTVETAAGRVCAAPTVSCPPAIPIVVSGERVPPDALPVFQYYGVRTVDVVCRGDCGRAAVSTARLPLHAPETPGS